MAKAFYFDMTSCIGCKACQIACKDKLEVEMSPGVFYRKVSSFETGAYPMPGRFNYSASCNHCENPACVAVCPTGAMYKAEDGTVQHDDSICDGCKMCAMACPYKVPQYVASINKVHKCDACRDLTAKGKNPACVDACVMRCLDFGEKEDLIAKYGPDLVCDLAILPSSEITNPNVLIKAKENALEGEPKEMLV